MNLPSIKSILSKIKVKPTRRPSPPPSGPARPEV